MKKFIVLFCAALFAGAAWAGTPADTADAPQAGAINPLLIGASVPDVTVKNAAGETVDLAKAAQEPTLLIFYRGGWCPICMRHLGTLAKDLDAIKDMGYQTLVISQDSPELAQQTKKKMGFDYEFLADPEMAAARAFGLAFQVDDQTVTAYKGYGIDLVGLYGRAQPILAVPAIFIIKDGKIRFVYANPDYRERIDGNVLKAALAAYAK